MKIWILLFFVSLMEWSDSVEVHFESPDSGFFLKHSPRQPPVSPEITNIQTSRPRVSQDSVLSVDRFTVVQTTQPVSIRASYGPFSTKQTVPARYIVPDAMETQGDHVNNTTAALMELQQTNLHLDISAHLVRSTIPRDSPVLRVLFHAGADPGGHLQRQKICVLLHASMGTRPPLKGRCMPEGEDGVCVAEVVIPSNWWPSLPPPEKDSRTGLPPKVPQRLVQVSYSVFEPPTRNPEQCEPKVQIQPLTSFAQIPLVAALSPYKDLRADDALTILIPQRPLYPMSKIHVPVFLHQQPDQNIAVFIVRARVKAGMKILGATTSSDDWNISVEKENPKHTVARVTAFRKDQDPDSTARDPEAVYSNKVTEVFSWLLEVANDTKENWDGGKIVWSVSYVYDGPKLKDQSAETTGSTPEETRRKLIAKLEVNKDDIQAVLPIAKNWELMNTAVLTGRQVSQAMKVFIVSQAGKVADVTLQSSCHAEDESVIKVSSSCSSVYVDGSEIRGSSNASIVVKYGTYIGLAKFVVWMPEFPLEVYVSDFRLSQIKGWKVPDDHHYNHGKMQRRRKKRAYSWNHHGDDFMNVLGAEKAVCRARYQQSPVEVYARFLAVDQDSGRTSYLISRRTGLRVTDLVQPLLRVADPKIAGLKGRILQGKSMGRTDVQVLSPITGRVIGAKEIRVGSDKVSLTRLIVRVVSGLQLSISPDGSIENGYIAETSVTRRLTAQYQEGLLDIDLEFSDGARTPLRDVSVDDYFLLVESLDTEVVAFAPMLASHHPRVIAVGEGTGDLLRVTLLVSEDCRLRRSLPLSKQTKVSPGPLASALASVQVDFNIGDTAVKPDTVQNDGIMGRERKGSRDSGDLADIIVGIPLKDDSHHHEPTVQARQHRGSINSINGLRHKPSPHGDMTNMEIGMYVLLTAFCFAIIVFVISCVVYASKFRPITIESGLDHIPKDRLNTSALLREGRRPRESTTNAHDWVWLGRSTMDRSSMIQDTANVNIFENPRDSRIRITGNPMSINYSDPDDAVNNITTSFDNPNPIQMPLTMLNTNTYNKNEQRPVVVASSPPPLPPHSRIGIARKGEYRPPVPPHRNIGITANVVAQNNNNEVNIGMEPVSAPIQKRHHHKHHRNSNHAHNRRSQVHGNIDLIRSYDRPPDQHMNFTQEQLSMALMSVSQQQQKYQQKSPEQTFSPHDISPENVSDSSEKHMAERLLENAAQQQKNAFQFDSLTPKRDAFAKANTVGLTSSSAVNGNVVSTINESTDDIHINGFKIEETPEVKRRHKKLSATSTPVKVTPKIDTVTHTVTIGTTSSSDDDGGFITSPPGEEKSRKLQVKRATVVGNPMFSSTCDGDIGPGESLGLDDLDMDYEQIMHYFDNLKESNA